MSAFAPLRVSDGNVDKKWKEREAAAATESPSSERERRRKRTRKEVAANAKAIDKELHALKKKYYAGGGEDSLKTVPLKSISDKKTKGKFKRAIELDEEAALENARRERYLMEPSGALEAEKEKGEETWRFQQAEIIKHVDLNAQKKAFDLQLEGSGPYRSVDFSPNGQHMVFGGSGDGGHVANVEWNNHKLLSEIYLDEKEENREAPTVKCVKYLHNTEFFAVAQSKYTYIYDKRGLEIHRLDKHRDVFAMDFLPKHFLLTTIGREGIVRWQDTTHGEIVAEHRTKLGKCSVLRRSEYNAVTHLGHSNGTVTLWSPNQGQPLVKMLCHRGRLNALAIDQSGRYMATTGLDCQIKVWDLRKYQELHAYYAPSEVKAMDISQRGMLAITYGSRVQIWNEALKTKAKSPYLNHQFVNGSKVYDVKFCPYEDVLAVGHSKGVTNILVPGSGEPNYDTFVANPFETKNQRREMEVQKLLDKLPSEMIQLDPNAIGQLRDVPKEVQKERREAALRAEMEAKMKQREKNEAKTKMKGKNRASKRYRKKQQNVIDDKMMAKLEAKKAREEGHKKRANEFGRAKPGAKAGAASDAPERPDDAPEALRRFYK
jgi:U3 small nucleolar RNA-associated protein 7